MTNQKANPYVAPAYLLFDMPANVLRGPAKRIQKWCAANGKSVPTLLHVDLARRARKVAR